MKAYFPRKAQAIHVASLPQGVLFPWKCIRTESFSHLSNPLSASDYCLYLFWKEHSLGQHHNASAGYFTAVFFL